MEKRIIQKSLIVLIFLFLTNRGVTQQTATISINTAEENSEISPYIFGKNNSLSDDSDDELTTAEWTRIRDAGIKMYREGGGNNSTKYNWRRKLSSHPDWYNNVYDHDWDFAAESLQKNIPLAQAMWSFQLIGKAAKTSYYNFNDWGYNQSRYWVGVSQNLAGNGTVDDDGGTDALVGGDIDLYLEDWTADSTTAILNHWFGNDGIGLDSTKVVYWSMDNEPEIWSSTHDDVYPDQPDAEEFMQLYFEVAKKARAKYPNIKLTGPVTANEWQWYNWDGAIVTYNGQSYPWLEYFILRVAEEQEATGIRLLDVLDIHFYPGETDEDDIVQLHRVFFDETYEYPGANGVKRLGSGGWDNSITREYIFKRCNDWLDEYMGEDHGVMLGLTETAVESNNANVTAAWYASVLGEFAKEGVEIFTPWTWNVGMYEVVHLFSNYAKPYYVDATSTNETYVSAYPTINADADSLTIFLVNRHLTETADVVFDIKNFSIADGQYTIYQLAGLSNTESFYSNSTNALEESKYTVTDNSISLDLPALSVTAIVLSKAVFEETEYGYIIGEAEAEDGTLSGVNLSQNYSGYSGTGYVTGFNSSTDKVTVSINIPENDMYKLVISYNSPGGQKYQDLLINGELLTELRFEKCSEFTYLDAGNYVLKEGTNTFSIQSSWGYTNIDKFEIYHANCNVYSIAPDLVDTAATDETKAFYEYLKLQFGERVISGQTRDSYDSYSTIENLTGKSPMIMAGDLSSYTEGYPYDWDNGHVFGKVDDGTVDDLIEWYNNSNGKGIVSFHWHWCSPSGGEAGTNTFYTSYTTFDITEAVTPGTDEYEDIIRDIDDIAAELQKFQEAGIPVLWRPLHEAGGGWFWWGAQGAEPCLELYDILYDRLMNYHELHNLIWVWSTPEEDWYPGNDKVDIIGYDSYPGEYNYTNQKAHFDELYRLTDGEKLIAMTENGPIPDPYLCFDGDAPWLFFVSWANLVTEQNTDEHISEVYEHTDVLTLESTNDKTDYQWRSELYPEDWQSGYRDNEGRFLHDFSYAGYHKSQEEIPVITDNIIDVTQSPYNADNTGIEDVTSVIQQALDDAGEAGGGVVYLPTGTYRIVTPESGDYGLKIANDSVVLRGAGADSTFIFHDQTYMRQKDIILVLNQYANWFEETDVASKLSIDLLEQSRIIPVESVTGFSAGDQVILCSPATDEFIEEHNMTGIWTEESVKGIAFMRTIDSIDTDNNFLFIDVPTRYALKTRDNAHVFLAGTHISECGIEDLSIGNTENSKSGWDEESYSESGTGAYDTHFSHAIHFKYSRNCWVKNVHTYKPGVNSGDYHLLSNCLLLNQSRCITVDSCDFQKPQYEGGGGNGYMYTMQSNDCLIKDCSASDARHNYDFKYPYCNGNVIHNCRAENSKYASDFHMYLSMANLFDMCTVNSDYLESVYRPYGDAIHGYSSSQSVFYNTTGEAYHPGKDYIIESRQYGDGYIIGTSGEAYNAVIDPAEGIINGYYYNTYPRDFMEGIGRGEYLEPRSLFLDQLERRMENPSGVRQFNVKVKVKNTDTNELIPDCKVKIYDEIKLTDESGIVEFDSIYEVFTVRADQTYYYPSDTLQYAIYSDTTITILLEEKIYDVTFQLKNSETGEVFEDTDITFNGTTRETDSNGEVTFSIGHGKYEYSVTITNYGEVTDSLIVVSDTTIDVYLTQEIGYLNFMLKSGTASVKDALVVLGSDSLKSDTLGITNFEGLAIPADYHYIISKSGYKIVEDNIYLDRDSTIYLYLETTSTNEIFDQLEQIVISPNPASNNINLSIPESIYSEIVLEITSIDGKQMYYSQLNSGNITLDISSFRSGMYIAHIIRNEKNSYQLFIKR